MVYIIIFFAFVVGFFAGRNYESRDNVIKDIESNLIDKVYDETKEEEKNSSN